MTRSLTTIVSLCLLTAMPTAALARRGPAAAAESRTAGLATRGQHARELVDRHFTALARGDADAVRALWASDARIVSVDGDGKPTRQRLAPALTRWLAHRDGLSWTIKNVHHINGREVEVAVQVVWNGTTFDDALRVKVGRNGTLRLVHKWSRPHADAGPAQSGY